MISKCPQFPIFLETVPPNKDTNEEQLKKKVDGVETVVAPLREKESLDGLFIPELSEEELGVAKFDSLQYALALKDTTALPCVPYKIVANLDATSLTEWVALGQSKGIQGSVFVGGLSSKNTYKFDVAEANQTIAKQHPDGSFSVGNICIPTRRKKPDATADGEKNSGGSPTATLDEPERVFHKTKNGCTFFPTQIIWDVPSTTALLKEYYELCQLGGVTPATIVLAITPIGRESDIKFLKSLRVKIDEEQEKAILASDERGRTSVDLIKKNLTAIVEFVKENKLDVPLGLLLSPMFPRNNKYNDELAEHWKAFRT
eukprot:TRINITY_DN55838_c0_g1_i1.p1 TRINITY_DN55838_c0_g1~~TRINITY_DN55838_c0_g1_i1.p1  ORF type:complete len:316 (+),score=58.31 TRINITY_DN55838_c0_g1_i1:80-1027(+)